MTLLRYFVTLLRYFDEPYFEEAPDPTSRRLVWRHIFGVLLMPTYAA